MSRPKPWPSRRLIHTVAAVSVASGGTYLFLWHLPAAAAAVEAATGKDPMPSLWSLTVASIVAWGLLQLKWLLVHER